MWFIFLVKNYRYVIFQCIYIETACLSYPIFFKINIKSSLYSPYYAEACNELRGPSPRLSAWATQHRRNVATVASRCRHYVDLTGPGIEPQTSRTDSVRISTELTAGRSYFFLSENTITSSNFPIQEVFSPFINFFS